MEREVETDLFVVRGDSEPHHLIDEIKDSGAHNAAVDECRDDGERLDADLREDRREIGAGHAGRREDTGEKGAHNAAHAMHAPAVKGVVVPELPLQNRDGPEADETGDKTNEEVLLFLSKFYYFIIAPYLCQSFFI